MTETADAGELLENLDRHFLACPTLGNSQLAQHRERGSCEDCTGAAGMAALGVKLVVSKDQPPGIIGMISRGPDFTSVAACALTDPPVVKARTIRHPRFAGADPDERPATG